MKPHFKILVGTVVALGITVPAVAREDPYPQSASAAATLTALLDQRKLESIATRDPAQPGRYIAALYIPGAQLLVVSSPYPVPAVLDKKIVEASYMDVYLDIQSVRSHEGQFFVMDSLADGLKRVCDPEQPFDSTSLNGGAHLSFDGKWQAQKLSEAEYDARFREDDAKYARMLEVLAGAFTAPKAAPAETRKGGR